MKKIMLSTLMILFITSCATQKYYSDNGKEISKKIIKFCFRLVFLVLL